MQVELEHTFDDLREANLAHQRYIGQLQQEEVKRSQKTFSRSSLLAWAIFGALVVLIMGLLRMTGPGGVLASVQNLWLKLLGPCVAFCVMWSGIAVISRRREYAGLRVQKTSEERKGRWKGLLGWAIFLGLAVLLFAMLQDEGMARKPAVRSLAEQHLAVDAVVVFAPWVVMIIFVWGFVWRVGRGKSALRKTWEGSPNFHRTQTLDADEEQLTLRDAVSRTESQWVAFTGFYESANLLLLYMGKFAFHIIPKRAFNAEQLEEFRHLVMSQIEVEQRRGFPVLPVKVDAEFQ